MAGSGVYNIGKRSECHKVGTINHRGKGLARRLVENVIEQERKAGKKALRLDVIENNITAEKLYQKLGFQYVQTKTLYYDVVGEMTFKLYELVL